MKDAQDNAATLRQHVMSTYNSLRMGIAIIGAALPGLLWLGETYFGDGQLLWSMSAYYYSVMRDIFVGALISIGLFLYLYKGFGTRENWALNLAGVFAVLIAIVPTHAPGEPPALASRAHGIFSVGLFLCIAYVSIFRAKDTLLLLADPERIQKLRRTYRALGVGMIVSPLVAVALTFTIDPSGSGRTIRFFVEAVAIWIFAAYWLVKSRELRATGAEGLAVEGKLEAAPPLESPGSTASPGPLVRVDAPASPSGGG